MYTGTLIKDLVAAVERAQNSAPLQPAAEHCLEVKSGGGPEDEGLESEQLPQALGLSAADGDLGLLLVVHPQLIRTLEPGNHLADAVDIHEVRAVGPPKKIRIEAIQQFFERPAVGLSLHARCARSYDCDHAILDPRIADVLLIHQKHAPESLQKDL